MSADNEVAGYLHIIAHSLKAQALIQFAVAREQGYLNSSEMQAILNLLTKGRVL